MPTNKVSEKENGQQSEFLLFLYLNFFASLIRMSSPKFLAVWRISKMYLRSTNNRDTLMCMQENRRGIEF